MIKSITCSHGIKIGKKCSFCKLYGLTGYIVQEVFSSEELPNLTRILQFKKESVQNMGKRTKIEIRPRNPKNKKDAENAKLMQRLVDHQFEKYEGVIDSITRAMTHIEVMYPFIKTGSAIWNNILESVIAMDIKEFEKQTTTKESNA